MIEYEISLLVRCSPVSLSGVLRTLDARVVASVDPKDAASVRLEGRGAYVDEQIDFAVNDFLDAVSIQVIDGVTAMTLKVSALFDPEQVAALNFELSPLTMARIARLGCGFDLWAMPVG